MGGLVHVVPWVKLTHTRHMLYHISHIPGKTSEDLQEAETRTFRASSPVFSSPGLLFFPQLYFQCKIKFSKRFVSQANITQK